MVVLLCATGPSNLAIASPSCLPAIEVAHAKAVRVEKNGVVVLADGRAARLEGVVLPAGGADRAPELFAQQAISALADLTANRVLDLAAAPPKEDRYGRIRAQVLVRSNGNDVWLQQEMLRRGLARVAITADRGECAEELYAVEAGARRTRAGLWSSPAYAIRTPPEAEDNIGTFQVVEGKVNSVSSSGGRVFLDFGSDEGAVFAATISTDDMKRFREIGVDPYAYVGERVRVRGWIERIHRLPEIALATPAQVEIVQ
ncbi:MAG TPA: thermonuclease family protein [Rhizomicrobium sp.]|nr:thermonuclease family protein [Rhizomicrobium sp.]